MKIRSLLVGLVAVGLSSVALAAEYLGDNSLIRTTITQPRNKHPYEAAWEVQLHAV